jgi:hypothetical protein
MTAGCRDFAPWQEPFRDPTTVHLDVLRFNTDATHLRALKENSGGPRFRRMMPYLPVDEERLGEALS